MKYGPVDVVVLAMGEPHFDGTILMELERLVDSGTIRVLDAMVLLMGDDGAAYGVDLEDLDEDAKARLGFIETGTRGLFDSADAAALSEGMVPGSAIVAVAIENAWAVPLMNAFMDVGAEVALTTRVPGPVFDDAMSARVGATK